MSSFVPASVHSSQDLFPIYLKERERGVMINFHVKRGIFWNINKFVCVFEANEKRQKRWVWFCLFKRWHGLSVALSVILRFSPPV